MGHIMQDEDQKFVEQAVSTFNLMLAPAIEDLYEVMYGVLSGQWGYHLIVTDYPEWQSYHMGETYEDAKNFVDNWLEEWRDDQTEDEDEEDDWPNGDDEEEDEDE